MEITGILMAGQSNMAGRGDFGEVPPIENPHCHMLRMGRWQSMSEPVNPDRAVFSSKFHSGISLAASFADSLAKALGKDIGLIPCADGGTEIARWMPGEILFDHAVFCTGLAARTSPFGGIIWHQGESDCYTEKAGTYGEELYTVLSELRQQTGGQQLPIVLGEIPHAISDDWHITVDPSVINRSIHQVAKELPLCGVASSEGLSMKQDGIHFSSEGARLFGIRYAEVYMEILSRSL